MKAQSFFRNFSYRKKMALCYFLIVSIPYMFGVFYLYSSIVRNEKTTTMSTLNQHLEHEAANIRLKVETVDNFLEYSAGNQQLNSFFTPHFYTDPELISTLNYKINPIISWMEAFSTNHDNFFFLTLNESIPRTPFFVQLHDYQKEQWLKEMRTEISEHNRYIKSLHQPLQIPYVRRDSGFVFSICRLLPFAGNTYVEMELSPGYLFSGINNAPLFKNGKILFIDQSNLVSDGKNVTSSSRYNLSFSELSNKKSKTIRIGNVDYFVSSLKIPELHGKLLYLLPQSEISRLTSKSMRDFIFLSTLITILIASMAYLLPTFLVKRINIMQTAVEKIQHEDYKINITTKSNDEIDQLAKGLNNMSSKIRYLIDEVYTAEINQRNAELMALQAQINPHFLFNILETFRMLVELDMTEQLSRGLESLGNLMRYNLSTSARVSTIKDELNIIKDYIELQNLLNNQLITLILEIPVDIYDKEIPGFIFQPIVENCIKHGMSTPPKQLTIRICATVSGEDINFYITNNGIGISPQKLSVLNASFKKYTHQHQPEQNIGLWNVNQRLILSFNPTSRLYLRRDQQKHLIVQFSIPRKDEK